MDVSKFFGYPDNAQSESVEEVVLLPEWDEATWTRLLDHAETRRFRPGDDVIRMGEIDRSLFIVMGGDLDVVVPAKHGQWRTVAGVGSGGLIGEVAFIDGRPRSSTVRARTNVEVARISKDAFDVFATVEPELARELLTDISRILAIRLRQATAALARA